MDTNNIDVLVITALDEELEALRRVTGDQSWRLDYSRNNWSYYRRSINCEGRRTLHVAAACPGKTGSISAATLAAQLITELDPGYLAMCGICAGWRKHVFLGDIIVAERVYQYNTGNHTGGRHFQDINTYNLKPPWRSKVQDFARGFRPEPTLRNRRPISKHTQVQWILRTLFEHEQGRGQPPASHPDRRRLLTNDEYAERIHELEHKGYIQSDSKLKLTDVGLTECWRSIARYPDGPPSDPEFAVHFAPIATCAEVQRNRDLFVQLSEHVSSTLGAEMEAAAIGYVSHHMNVPSMIVKCVSDYGDEEKDDRYRKFACEASAQFLFAFLSKHVESRDIGSRAQVAATYQSRRTRDLKYHVEDVCRARFPQATIREHYEPVRAGHVLVVTYKETSVVETRLIAAVEESLNEGLVRELADEVLPSYRRRDPFTRLTIIYEGDPPQEDLVSLMEKEGVYFESLSQFSGIIDFRPYTEWLERKLDESSSVYSPLLYVPQRAEFPQDANGRTSGNVLKDLLLLLHQKGSCFTLIQGDFGTGKTFLMRQLAEKMISGPIIPILIEMRSLEKAHDLNVLVAQHLAQATKMRQLDWSAFHYMLRQGRIALLFDGFDELVQRVTFARAAEHLETLANAAQGEAKVIVTCRAQHFFSDAQLKTAIDQCTHSVDTVKRVNLLPFTVGQIEAYIKNHFRDDALARGRIALLRGVKSLLGLSANPRMLSFVCELDEERLVEASRQGVKITVAGLFNDLIKSWFLQEDRRVRLKGSEVNFTMDERYEAVTTLAEYLWNKGAQSISLYELPKAVSSVLSKLSARGMDGQEGTYQIASGTLLSRDAHGIFSFIHQSVLEWLVAKRAAAQWRQEKKAYLLRRSMLLSDIMADFFIYHAGANAAEEWVRATMAEPVSEGDSKGNALTIRARLRILTSASERQCQPADASPDGQSLADQDLRGRDLSGENLSRANLDSANLSGVLLVRANLAGARMCKAKLDHADLWSANLENANLTNADLSYARLSFANLKGATLLGANLRGAKLVGAKLGSRSSEILADLAGVGAAPPSVQNSALTPMVSSTLFCCAVAWSPSGDIVAVGQKDGAIKLLDPVTGQTLRVLRGHYGLIHDLSFSRNGLLLASASQDKTVRLWTITTGACLVLDGHRGPVKSISFSADGTKLASGSQDKTVRLWSVNSTICIALFVLEGHTESVESVAFAVDGSTIASGSEDGTIHIWSAVSGRLKFALSGHRHGVNCVAFSPDGLLLASASSDRTVRLWNGTESFGTSEDTSFVGFGLWESPCPSVELSGHASSVESVAFSPDGMNLASASEDGIIRLWSRADRRLLRVFGSAGRRVHNISFSADGQKLAASIPESNSVAIWSVIHDGSVGGVLMGQPAVISSIAFRGDSTKLISTSSNNMVRVWDVPTGCALGDIGEHDSCVRAVAFSPQGTCWAAAFGRRVRLWDTQSLAEIGTFEGHRYPVNGIAFNQDGTMAASCSEDGTVRIFYVSSEREVRVLHHGGPVYSVAFSPNGSMIASASGDGKARLWSVATDEATELLAHAGPVRAVAFHPHGALLASGSDDTEICLWSATGVKGRSLNGHSDRVTCVAFHPHGTTLASGSFDNTVRIWDPVSGQSRHILTEHHSPITSVTFSPNGRILASGSLDNTIRLWTADTGKCIATLVHATEGWATFTPDGRYKISGNMAGAFWHVLGLCRFEPTESQADFSHLRMNEDVPLF
jgi:WD40 repeat protein/nucleoside phosphorylase